MSRIFLSHSSQDNFAAIALADWLKSEGWDDIFLDLDPERGIAAGERWERKLHEAANRCEAVIFLISANWLASGWCLKEYALARGLNKKLIAVLIDAAKTIADLPPELTGTWQVVDLAHRQDLQILRVADPNSHEEQHVAFSREGLRRLKGGLEKAGLDPKFFAWPPENEPDRAPYRGLQALDSVDAGIFFGRDAPIVTFTDALRGLSAAAPPRLLVILGASGAGKSSFLRAGLLPRLKREDRRFLPLKPIRPERAALTGESGFLSALEAAFPDHARAALRSAIKEGANGVRPLLAKLADQAFREMLAEDENVKPPAIVISIDQAEELFRAEGAEEATGLLDLIRDLAACDDPAIIAIFALRSDSYDALQNVRALEGLAQMPLSLPPMPHNAYREVIEGPARRVVAAGGKLSIEPQLVDRLLDDIDKGATDALPLLAFTLEQLYREYGGSGALRLKDYESFGGLKGTIDAAVERAFRHADMDPRIPRDRLAREHLLRRGLIPWLAGIDPDSKSPRRNIARRSEIPAEAMPLIDLLVEERLLSTDLVVEKAAGQDVHVATIEPTHEALLRQWGLLEGWLAEDFGLLAALESVKRAARDWDANGRATAWLAHQGQRLTEAEGLDARPDIAAKFEAADRAYLAECRALEEARRAEAEQRRREREEEQTRRLADAEKLAAANRRIARRTGIGLAAALLLASAAAGFGLFAQNERSRAEKTLALATRTANGLVFDLAEKFRNAVGVPAATVADILDRARQLQDQLQQSGQANADLMKSKAAALDETADTLLALGETQGALAAAQEARNILASLLSQRPDDPFRKASLALSLNEVGEIQSAQGDLGDALRSYQASRELIEPVANANPSNKDWQHDLSVLDQSVGDLLQAQGDLAEALKSYSAARTIMQALVKADPEDASWSRDLSVADLKIGDVLVMEANPAEALKSYRDALAVRESLAKADPGNTGRQRDLSVAYERLGYLFQVEGNLPAALQSYQRGLDLRAPLARSDPSNAGWQRDLSIAYDNVGDIQRAQGNLADALKSYRASLAIREDLTRADASNAGLERDLSVAELNVGDIEMAQGDLAGALKSYDAGIKIREKLAKSDPQNASWQGDLAAADQRLAALEAVQGDFGAALTSFEAAIAIEQHLTEIDPRNAIWRNDLSISESGAGDALFAQGNPAAALKHYQASFEIREALAKAAPGNAEVQRTLVESYQRIALADLANGDKANAQKNFAAGRAKVQELIARDPNDANWKKALAWFDRQIASIGK
ncbi:MAG TPA: TIR domain-containing protein [Gemmataceae bacterium]|nr:TIR domain-containing protein [Gemmataceae bacterium]